MAGHSKVAPLMEQSLDDRLQTYVGKGGDRYIPARDSITAEGIRKMIEVVGDRNPIYSDADFAVGSVHGGLVPPPPAILAFWLKGFQPAKSSHEVDAQGVRHFRLDPFPVRGTEMLDEPPVKDQFDAFNEIAGALTEAGYSSRAGVGGELNLKRYPKVGDHLFYSDAKLHSIAGPKSTKLGEGYFTTLVMDVKDRQGHAIGDFRLQSFIFAPAPSAVKPTPAAEPAKREPPALRPWAESERVSASSVAVGQELPSLVVEVTPSLIIAGALFSNDISDVHHDRHLAVERGYNDYFMCTSGTLLLVSRFVTDWAGPSAFVERITWRLGAQQYSHDPLYLTGRVSEVERLTDSCRITVEVAGNNSRGLHANCTVRLLLPLA